MQSCIGRIGKFLAAALLLLPLAQLAQAAEPRADIGVFDANGKLTLDLARFQDKFSDGMPVTEVRIDISNGFYYLTRKGFNMISHACRREAVQLQTAAGQAIAVGSTVAGQHGWVITGEAVQLLGCQDDGCHALKGIPSAPLLQSARCDVTELSDNRCKCHINDGSGEKIAGGDFCNSFTEVDSLIVAQWVKLAFIVN